MPFVFPVHLLNPKSVKLTLTAKVVQSPPSLSGVTQAVRTDGGGLWQAQYSGIVLRTAEQLRLWRAWDSYLGGGAQIVAVPVLTNGEGPRGVQGRYRARYGDLHVTGEKFFPDAVDYALPLVVASAGSAALRATALTIAITRGVTPVGGENFSIRHSSKGNRLYRIVRPLGSGSYQIDPPLREAVAQNTPLNFDWPVFDASIASGTDIAPDVANGRSEVSIAFQEAF